jgi:hypothetical protein
MEGGLRVGQTGWETCPPPWARYWADPLKERLEGLGVVHFRQYVWPQRNTALSSGPRPLQEWLT